MRALLFIAIFFCIAPQIEVVSQVRYPVGRINVNTNPGGIVEQINTPIEFVRGELYVIDSWEPGYIYLKSGTTLKTDSMRYNIMENYLEIAKEGSVKFLTPKMMSSFEITEKQIKKRFFINAESFENTYGLSGFFEVLNEGDINLLIYHDHKELAPNYNPALDVGSKVPTFHKEQRYFITSNYEIKEVPSSKKDFIQLFDGELSEKVKSFMKSEKLNHRKTDELLAIIKYLNR